MVRSFKSRMSYLVVLVVFILSSMGMAAPVGHAAPLDQYVPFEPTEKMVPPVPGATIDPYTNAWIAPQPGDVAYSQALQGVAVTTDVFGYTYASTTYAWIDAVSGGENTGLKGVNTQTEVFLPFDFKFYENTYTSIAINSSGYLTFNLTDAKRTQSNLPSGLQPNNVIAPFWTELKLAQSGSTNQVFSKQGTNSLGEYFVVQWNQVLAGPNSYTFEVVLYKSGDIVFSYKTMADAYYCASAGIENSTGSDGLASNINCQGAPKTKSTVKFTRPAARARVIANPLYRGQFVQPGQDVVFPLELINGSDLGADRFDIAVSSTWPVILKNSADNAELTDTDSSGTVDTGLVNPSVKTVVNVHIQAPNPLNIGDYNNAVVTITPAGAGGVPLTMTLSTTYAAPFTQALWNGSNLYHTLLISDPDTQKTVLAAKDSGGYEDASVTETANGNLFYVWRAWKYYSNLSRGYYEIYYAVVSKTGAIVKAATRLSDLSTFPNNTTDGMPAVAATPNGRVGVLFRRVETNSSGNRTENLRLYIMSESGTRLSGLIMVTDNTNFGSYDSNNSIDINEFAIAGTTNNYLAITFDRVSEPKNEYSDIYWVAYNSSTFNRYGTQKKLTSDTSGSKSGYRSPHLTTLPDGYGRDNGSVLLTFVNWNLDSATANYARFMVLDSSGNKDKSTFLPNTPYAYGVDAAVLSNNKVFIAWQSKDKDIQYVILNEALNTTSDIFSMKLRSTNDESIPSVTADKNGHAIVTWAGLSSMQEVIYALIDSSGVLVTPPMAMFSAISGLDINQYGSGNTTHTIKPTTTNAIDLAVTGSGLAFGTDGGSGVITLDIRNLGLVKATGVTLTADLPAGLTVDAPMGSCTATTCTWDLADLAFLGKGIVTMNVEMPASPAGTNFPLTFTVDGTQTESLTANNTLHIGVYATSPTYLPMITK